MRLACQGVQRDWKDEMKNLSELEMDLITVIDVFRDLRVVTDPKKTWAAGAAARDHWQEVTGMRPMTPLRSKTNGPGSHCMAVYPRAVMYEKISEIIRSLETEAQKQGELFEV